MKILRQFPSTLAADLLVRSVQPDAQGLFWRQVQQGSDGAGGTFAGAQLQQLAQEHQGDDDGRGGHLLHYPEDL